MTSTEHRSPICVLVAFAALLLLLATSVRAEPSGRISFDYLSLIPPQGWTTEMTQASARVREPLVRDDSRDGCSLYLTPAQSGSGDPSKDLETFRYSGFPANRVPKAPPALKTTSNGVTVIEQTYIHPYVPSEFLFVLGVSRDKVVQHLLATGKTRCAAQIDAALKSARVLETRERIDAGGTRVSLDAPSAATPSMSPDSKFHVCRNYSGDVCLVKQKVGTMCWCDSVRPSWQPNNRRFGIVSED